jgi:hypothetical protein
MTMDAVRRVPAVDWLMALTVLTCGIAAIVAVWRYADGLVGAGGESEEGPDEGRGRGGWDVPLALPPGPANTLTLVDAIDEELWGIIETERTRLADDSDDRRTERIAARLRPVGSVAEPGTPRRERGAA